MSCAPWANDKERADYYESQFKNQLAITERLETELDAARQFNCPNIELSTNGVSEETIIAGLECLAHHKECVECDQCAYYMDNGNICDNISLARDVLNMYNRQQQELQKLQKFKAYFDDHSSFDLEILGYTEDGDLTPFYNFYQDAVNAMNGNSDDESGNTIK